MKQTSETVKTETGNVTTTRSVVLNNVLTILQALIVTDNTERCSCDDLCSRVTMSVAVSNERCSSNAKC